jgi:hypothetical protein
VGGAIVLPEEHNDVQKGFKNVHCMIMMVQCMYVSK